MKFAPFRAGVNKFHGQNFVLEISCKSKIFTPTLKGGFLIRKLCLLSNVFVKISNHELKFAPFRAGGTNF
ncbi:hypothetical protein B0A70_13515 [Chryseobacterium piscicola]|uniref:Uncharacterized protein n=1 Tax=Chryseobacterium piscicola TaxID=551459 RepID=A0A2S7KCH7_9FLAO|nr:hypothetical protein B0A70_13515 [Chryseobacterium piscicola]